MHVRPDRQHVLHPVSSHIYEANAFAAVIRDSETFFSNKYYGHLINRSFRLIYGKYLHTRRKAKRNFTIIQTPLRLSVPLFRQKSSFLHVTMLPRN